MFFFMCFFLLASWRLAMETAEAASSEFESFLNTGVYRLRVPPPAEETAAGEAEAAVFVDPVRVLDDCYARFRVSRCSYYTRSFDSPSSGNTGNSSCRGALDRKEKRRKRKRSQARRELDEKERAAERRHQEARPLLLAAHKAFLEASSLHTSLPHLVKCEYGGCRSPRGKRGVEQNFVALGGLWQAPLCEISLCFKERGVTDDAGGHSHSYLGTSVVPLFNNFVSNETNDDVEAEFGNNCYILPCKSSFYMSDLKQVRNLIPAHTNGGFNLIVIDPPWENGSAHQKAAYPTMPNRYFLYLPVKELAHREGALVALWMTNREKLHMFVEKELFPAWGVEKHALYYWLKVAPNGSLICDLDLFHHRPYECVLLGYVNMQDVTSESKGTVKQSLNNRVIISIPGAYSRKPPLHKLLMDHTPGPKPVNCIELFARELMAGWTSWGNEALHFQDSIFFVEKGKVNAAS